jgi:hypothetical protein
MALAPKFNDRKEGFDMDGIEKTFLLSNGHISPVFL